VIVSCPYCSTRYEIDAARFTGPNPMLKCSRCRHIFPAPSSKKPHPPPRRGAEEPTPGEEESLTLPFDEPDWKDEPDTPTSPDLEVPETEEGFTLGTEDEADEPRGRAEPTPPKAAPHFSATDKDEDEVQVERPAAEDSRGRRNRRERARRKRERTHIGPLFLFLAIVVAGYGLLTRALFASPALCDRLVSRLPVIGNFGDDPLLARKVALSDVVGGYQRIKDGKDVFVITGKALNTAPVALHGVQVAGDLYNNAGRVLETKTIYCGNVISAKVLKDLTPREVSILQKLSPPKKFVIEPGESSTFVIVFMDPPRETVEFTARVVGVQRQA
jgi:predicted Zn finger-like uncharacterized protein